MQDIFNNFDVLKSDPFKLKDILKEAANNSPHPIDLSRGDPCDPPGSIADSVFNFFHSTAINIQKNAFGQSNYVANLDEYLVRINSSEEIIKYVPTMPAVYENSKYYLKKIEEIVSKTDLASTNNVNIFKELIKGIRSSGYGNELGEPIVRAVISWYLKETLPNVEQTYSSIVLTLGGSEAVSIVFKVLKSLGFLPENSLVSAITPIYGPYNEIFCEYQLKCTPLETHHSDAYDLTKNNIDNWHSSVIEQADKGHSRAPTKGCRAFVLVNPSNPTGRVYSSEILQYLADRIKALSGIDERKTIVIEDIVYYDFMTSSKSKFSCLAEYLPEQTILVGSMSKTFRATGNRFGYLVFPKQTVETLNNQFSNEMNQVVGLNSFIDTVKILKSPDKKGAFSHTHMVPRISQWLGSIRLVFYEEDNKLFLENISKRWFSFQHIMKIKPIKPAVPYYIVVDFKKLLLERAENKATDFNNQVEKIFTLTGNFTIEKFIYGLARRGIIGLPASRFYIGKESEHTWEIRFSVANQSYEQITIAAEVINKFIDDILNVCGSEVINILFSFDSPFQLMMHSKDVFTVKEAAYEKRVYPEQVMKTMVCKDPDNYYYIALLPGNAELSVGRLGKILGVDTTLVDKTEVTKIFNIIVGAISPLQFYNKAKKIIMDPRISQQPWITMSSGNPIAGVKIETKDLRNVLGDLCTVSSEELS